MRRVLVIGGYGAVGAHVCRLLAEGGGVTVVVAGRSEAKARALAESLGGAWCTLDATEPESLAGPLADVDVVINAFTPLGEPDLTVPRAALAQGVPYLDLAGVPFRYTGAFLALDEEARGRGVTMVTGVGANPGIPGIVVVDGAARFDRVEAVDVFLTMGSNLDAMSVLSMRGIGEMMEAPVSQWRDGAWRKPKPVSLGRVVGPPFERKIYFGAAVATPDLLGLPEDLGIERFAFWSGMERMLQGTAFLLGVKTGRARTDERAARFLRVLRWLGGRAAREAFALEIEVRGTRQGRRQRRTVFMWASEEALTAAAPVVACRQLLDGVAARPGASVAHAALPSEDFLQRLAQLDVAYEERWEDL